MGEPDRPINTNPYNGVKPCNVNSTIKDQNPTSYISNDCHAINIPDENGDHRKNESVNNEDLLLNKSASDKPGQKRVSASNPVGKLFNASEITLTSEKDIKASPKKDKSSSLFDYATVL